MVYQLFRRLFFISTATLILIFACLPSVHADDILDYLPEDSLGFAVVRDLNRFNAKAAQLTKMFELPVPPPLTFVQFATGLSEGLDLDGDLLLAVLPGTELSSKPQPMVLLPILDYAKFAVSINGDESGEVCRVTVAGEDVLIAKQGPYALLMDVEHRETLELLIGLEPGPVGILEPLDPWIAGNDVTVALMPAGVELLLGLGRQGLDAQQEQFAEQFKDPQFEELAQQMENNIALSKFFLEMVGAEIKMGAVGLAVDDQANLRLGKRILLSNTGIFGNTEPIDSSVSPLAGYTSQPYVVAGGGPFPESWSETLAALSLIILEKMPDAYGLEDLAEEKWNELEEMYVSVMQGVRFSSMIMVPGEKGDPLFSNLYGIVKAADAEGYLDSYQKSMETWNDILAQSSGDIKLQYELTSTTVGDFKACEIVVDVAVVAQDPNVPMFNWMLEAMFGEDGKFHQMLIAADEKTIVYGMAGQDQLTVMIDNVQKGVTGLSDSAEVQTTMKLLSDNAPWKMVISPPGCVQWATRFVNEFLVHLQGSTVDIPEFPPCPPVGISMNVVDARVEVDMVWASETLEALAEYIKKCRAL